MATKFEVRKAAVEAWEGVTPELFDILKGFEREFSAHRDAVAHAQETGEDPNGLLVDGRATGLLLTVNVSVESSGKTEEQDFTVVYEPSVQTIYLLQPAVRGKENQAVSHDPGFLRGALVTIIDDFTLDMLRKMHPGSDSEEMRVSMSAKQRDAGFGREVVIELDEYKPGYPTSPWRVISTQPVERYREAQAEPAAKKM